MLKAASLPCTVALMPRSPATAAHQRSMVEHIASGLGWALTSTSMTYLKAIPNASGRANLPTPISAAPTTSRICGFNKDRNLSRGFFEVSASFPSIKRLSFSPEFIYLNPILLGCNGCAPLMAGDGLKYPRDLGDIFHGGHTIAQVV